MVTQKAFWAMPIRETLQALETQQSGLSDATAQKHLKTFGFNGIEAKERNTMLRIFVRQFRSPLIFILVGAGTLTLFLQDWPDSIVIFLAVILNTGLGFYQENRADKALQRLQSYLKDRVRVLREGLEREVDVSEIVPGDIIHLTAGDRVPADARLLHVKNVEVDESILTGESFSVAKTTDVLAEGTELADRTNVVFAGTTVLAGSGIAAVYATGRSTEIGRLAQLVAATQRTETPLQRSIKKLAWFITAVLTLLVGVIFLLGVVRGQSFFDMFLVSVAIAVSSIPEALPISLTVILAVGVERLVRRNGVVRTLAAAETLGSTTVILTDKTGTLTEAKMKLADIVGSKLLVQDHVIKHTSDLEQGITEEQLEILKLALFNTDVLIENPHDAFDEWRMVGSPIESSLVKAGAEYGLTVASLRKRSAFHALLLFNSSNKFSVTYVEGSEEITRMMHQHFLVVVGAPDILLQRSSSSEDFHLKIIREIEALADTGKRIVAVAIKPVKERIEKIEPDAVRDLDFIGIIAFHDPLRPDVAEAMRMVERYGVRTIMVTGDLTGTALSVAEALGWKATKDNCIVGSNLRIMSDDELRARLDDIRIFARITPEDKMRIARAYQERGDVVAMTGDGVNDAPSLKAVDIGIAMGSGTDVAKDVSDLVLLDDNFKTIVAAIEEGRRIAHNIRKAIVYLLSDALDEVLLIGGSLLFGLPLPLTALQILWVNFFSDSLPALTFAFDENLHDDLHRHPKGERKIIDGEVKFLILGIGISTSALLFFVYWFLLQQGFDIALVRTFIFVAFGLYTILLAFPLRSLRQSIFSYNVLANKLMLAAVGFGIVLIGAAVYVPPLQDILKTRPLPLMWVLGVIGWFLFTIATIELTKWFFRRKH